MLARYVLLDLRRNPRRTLAALVGVTLGVGLFSGVLFFIDGSGASMTKRAIAPLALDLQRVIGAPPGGGLRFAEQVAPAGPLRPAQTVTVTLTVRNRTGIPANEVVIRDEPPQPLVYVPGSTRLNGRRLPESGGRIPLAHGPARVGLNLGTLASGRAVRISYVARALRSVPEARGLPLLGRISTREAVIPSRPNIGSQLTVEQLAAAVRRLPGVAAADVLGFVDLPRGSLRAARAVIADPVRVFAFDSRYLRHYPSIALVSGTLRPGATALSPEAARALGGVQPGVAVTVRLPNRRALRLPVSAMTDLSRARPLFYSRKASNLEEFRYVPDSIVVDPGTFRNVIIPAFHAGSAAYGIRAKTAPLRELDVLVRRSRLHADPGTALSQTQTLARLIRAIAPGQDYLIDNISNALQVARDDAAVAKRMFLFLGLPGALLGALLAAYAGSILAAAQRRELAVLRIRGANRRHLLRMLAYRTVALAGLGSLIGTGLGLLSVLLIIGGPVLFQAAAGKLLVSAALGVGVGLLVTALALYIPGRRSLGREISEERAELSLATAPAWQRLRLDVALLVLTALGELIAIRAGAFDAPHGSVYAGRAVSLPSYLLLGPIAAWIAGTLLCVRLFEAAARRVPLPSRERFGHLIRGILTRTLRRRSWTLAGGVIAVGLVVALGISLAIFAATYDAAKAADSRFLLGSDLRVTPSVVNPRPSPPGFAARLEVPGVVAATPVVFRPGNSVLTSAVNEDQTSLAAIDPSSFTQVAALSDAFFAGGSSRRTLGSLASNPRGVLVDTTTADNLKIKQGDSVHVLLARGTKSQQRVALQVLGLFDRVPGLPATTNLVVNLGYYDAATGLRAIDFYLARATDRSDRGVAAAVAALRTGPLQGGAFSIDTTRTALDKDQSSLTALNVHGLLRLDSVYTLLMAVAGIGIFVFGLMLQRRREYVTLRAQGIQTRELRALVLGEAAIVTLCGTAAGLLVGAVTGYLLVHVLRPLFVLDPRVTISAIESGTLALLVVAATIAASVAATALLSRLRPTELLREA